MSAINNPWTKISGEVKYDNPWIKVEEHQVINPGGGQGIYGKVCFKNKAIGIIPIDNEGYTCLVGQYRYTLDEYSWEIPMGGGPNEKDILGSAKRELKEETGFTAARWTKLLRIHTSNSVTDEEGFVFIAESLTAGNSELEETESDLKIQRLPLTEAVQMATDGRITDAISIAGLLAAARIKGI